MNELVRVKKKWMKYAPHQWWGDSIDVRFYLMSQLKELQTKRILDVGCSIGITLTELDSSNEKYGIDIDSEVLQKARRLNSDAHFLLGSFFDGFPYRDKSFDVVIMANVMPYHEICSLSLEKEVQKNTVFNEIYRVLKPGGKLFLTTPNGEYCCYLRTQKIHLAELQHDLTGFKHVEIYGWNPLPSFVFFLPNSTVV